MSTCLILLFWVKCLALKLFTERVKISIMLIQTIKIFDDIICEYCLWDFGFLRTKEQQCSHGEHCIHIIM